MSVFDPEREQSLQSRRWALDYASDYDASGSFHLPASSTGHVCQYRSNTPIGENSRGIDTRDPRGRRHNWRFE
jgi:hypothetical protein